jgi:hypothetical protein
VCAALRCDGIEVVREVVVVLSRCDVVMGCQYLGWFWLTRFLVVTIRARDLEAISSSSPHLVLLHHSTTRILWFSLVFPWCEIAKIAQFKCTCFLLPNSVHHCRPLKTP